MSKTQPDESQSMPPQLLSTGLVLQLIGLSRVTLYRKVRCGEFPAPLKLTENRNAYLAEEVSRWIEERKAERDKRIAAGR